jgi:acyl-CoA synthetase (NDP forming)
VIVYKAGRTEQGKTASAGHTAAVSGDYLVCRKILNRCGALIVSDFEEFYDMLNLCCMLRVKKIQGTRTGALSNAGYETVGIADNIRGENYRLELLEFTEQTKKKIKEIISAKSLEGLFDIRNPLDLTPMADDQANEQIFRTILADRNVDCAIYSTVPFTTKMNTLPEGKAHSENISDPSGIVQGLIRLFNESSKPFICSVDAGSLYDPMALELEKNGIPVFRSVDRAVKVFGKYVCHKLKKTCLIHDGTMRTLCTMKKNDQKF